MVSVFSRTATWGGKERAMELERSGVKRWFLPSLSLSGAAGPQSPGFLYKMAAVMSACCPVWWNRNASQKCNMKKVLERQ